MLDLSSNKLSGELLDSFSPPNTTLLLAVNHLSGRVPSPLRETHSSVDVLDGNLFGCPTLETDVNARGVPCGSSSMDSPLITWIVLVSTITVLLLAVRYYYSTSTVLQQVRLYVGEWWRASSRCFNFEEVASNSSDLHYTKGTLRYTHRACSVSLSLSAFYFTAVMLSLVFLKLGGNSVYHTQYLYTTTAAYTEGAAPLVVLWLYVTVSGLLAAVMCVSIRRLDFGSAADEKHHVRRIEADADRGDSLTAWKDSARAFVVTLPVGLVTSIVILLINLAYVLIVTLSKPPHLTAIQLAFTVVNLVLNSVVVPFTCRVVPLRSRQSYTVFMAIMVSVIAPSLATLLVSPLCLYDLFHGEMVESSFTYQSPPLLRV